MPIKPVTYYEAWCDGCGERQELWGDYTASAHKDTIEDAISDSDGRVVGGVVLCSACVGKIMAGAGDDDAEWDRRHDLLHAENEWAVRGLLAAPDVQDRPA